MNSHRFKLAMYLVEPMLPFQGGFDFAAKLAIKQRGLKLLLLPRHNHFKGIHLSDLDLDTMEEHGAFRKTSLSSSVQWRSAATSVWTNVFSFLWPGEMPDKVTWQMRWMTRGDIIADADMDKLTKAFSIVAEMAERHDIDVAVSMMPWSECVSTRQRWFGGIHLTGVNRVRDLALSRPPRAVCPWALQARGMPSVWAARGAPSLAVG